MAIATASPAAVPEPNSLTWLAAACLAPGVASIAFDARNPNPFPIELWTGIAGPGGAGSAGSGDVYASSGTVKVASRARIRPRAPRAVADPLAYPASLFPRRYASLTCVLALLWVSLP